MGTYTVHDDAGEHTLEATGHSSTVILARGPVFTPEHGQSVLLRQIEPPVLFLATMFGSTAVLGRRLDPNT